LEIGTLLRKLQLGMSLSMPHSRPMPSIGKGCHELRVTDAGGAWRLHYRIDADAILVLEWEEKKTQATSQATIERCKKRMVAYDAAKRGSK
jgi:phage-related protein